MIISLILFLRFSVFNASNHNLAHPIHISQTEVNYSTKDKTLQVAAKLYIDDFDAAIKKSLKKDVFMYSAKEVKDAETWIAKYILNNLIISIANKPIKLEMIGRETSENELAVWVYFESTPIGNPAELNIDARYMYDIYDDQKNMVDIKIDGRKKKFLMMEEDKTAQTVSLR